MSEQKINYLNMGIIIVSFIIVAIIFMDGFGIRGDYSTLFNSFLCPLRESIIKYKTPIEWEPYRGGGQAGTSMPEVPLFEIAYIFYLIFNDPNIAATLAAFSYLLFGIVGIYLLVFKLTQSNKAAVLASVFFSLNEFIITFYRGKSFNYLTPYTVLPWIFLLYLNIGKSKKKIISNSILIGILLSVALLAGGMPGIVWVMFGFPLFLFIDSILLKRSDSSLLAQLKKIITIFLIVSIIFAGLSAFKLYPSTKFIEKTNRNTGFNPQEFIGKSLELKNFIALNLNQTISDNWMKTGLMPLILISIGFFFSFRKRNFLKFFILFLLCIIIASNFLSAASLLSHVPVLNKARHVIRISIVYQLTVCVLLGLSFNAISKKIDKKRFKIINTLFFILILSLLLIELLYLPIIKTKNKSVPIFLESEFEKHTALKYLSNMDSQRHRVHMLGLDWVEGGAGEQYFCKLGIETMDWVLGNAWIIDYTTFTVWAGSNLEQAAKLWGILNTKYITASDPQKTNPLYTKDLHNYKNETDYFVPGLKLVKKFPSCKECSPDIIYIYENEKFLPRIFFVDKSILILGEKEKLYSLYQPLLLNEHFDPKNTVLINKNDIKDEDLSKYSAIILTSQRDAEDIQKIKQFKDKGGEIFPDIFNNENNIKLNRLNALLQTWNKESEIKTFDEIYYSPNKRIYKTKEALKGFVVISEQFYKYEEEWSSTLNSENKAIYNANFIVSAIYLDNEKGELEFTYNPIYFKRGAIISIITLLLIIIIFILLNRPKIISRKSETHN